MRINPVSAHVQFSVGMRLVCTDHPEWGEWTITAPSVPGCWEIRRARGGERVLDESEARRFWHVVHVQTVTLRNGAVVAAKRSDSGFVAITYTNRTQAEALRAKLGAGWEVLTFGRPFYVCKGFAYSRERSDARLAAGLCVTTFAEVFTCPNTVSHERRATGTGICQACEDHQEAVEGYCDGESARRMES